MDLELRKFTKIWATAALSGCYCYTLSKHTQKGFFRFLLLLPIIVFFATTPYSFPTSRTLSTTAWFSFSWLGISKLLLLAFGTGPLTKADQSSLPHFICTLLLPIKSSGSDPVKSEAGGLLKWAVIGAKAVGLVCFIKAYDSCGEGMPYWGVVVAYCCYSYLGLEVFLGITGGLPRALLGIELAPQADKPHLSTSLQDFWGKRWNLMVSDVLRQTVYNPIRKLATPFIGKKPASLVGVFASFVLSGLMHEWLYTILNRAPPSWEVTWFFSLHGACLVIELIIKEGIGNKLQLHHMVSGSFTIGFVVVTSAWWHFPTVLRSNTHENAMEKYVIF